MTDFTDVTTNDTVYYFKPVHASDASYTNFWVPRLVTRTTKKQFEVQGIAGKFRKSDGYCIGGGYSTPNIKRLGDKHYNEYVTNQLPEHNAYIELQRTKHEVQDLLAKIKSAMPEMNDPYTINEIHGQLILLDVMITGLDTE